MKKAFWLIVLIVLIPLWCALYLFGMIGIAATFLWDSVYHSVYKLAGSPLDDK